MTTKDESARAAGIDARLKNASPGPWTCEGGDLVSAPLSGPLAPDDPRRQDMFKRGDAMHVVLVQTDNGAYGPRAGDLEFIAAAREDVEWLLADRRTLLERIYRLEEQLARTSSP